MDEVSRIADQLGMSPLEVELRALVERRYRELYERISDSNSGMWAAFDELKDRIDALEDAKEAK